MCGRLVEVATVKYNDYKLDNNTGSVTAEMNTVYANCYDNSVGVDANVFLINNGTGTNAGLTARTLKSSWIMMNSTSNPSNTIAHELGHSCFSFVDITTDLDNIMNSYLIPNSPAKLRKNQWDMMHP